MNLRHRAIIDLTLQETEDLQQAAEKKGITLEELLDKCFQEAVDLTAGARKLSEELDGMECPQCGSMNVMTCGEFDNYCRRCGQKFDLS